MNIIRFYYYRKTWTKEPQIMISLVLVDWGGEQFQHN